MLKAFLIAFGFKVAIALAFAAAEMVRLLWVYRLAEPWRQWHIRRFRRSYLRSLDRAGIERVEA